MAGYFGFFENFLTAQPDQPSAAVVALSGNTWSIPRDPAVSLTIAANKTLNVISATGSRGSMMVTGNGYSITFQEGAFSQTLPTKVIGSTLIIYANFNGNRIVWVDNVDAGQRGTRWWYGTTSPSTNQWNGIIDGDYFLNTTNGDVWNYVASVPRWDNVGNIKGPSSTGGNTGGTSTANNITFEPASEEGWNSPPNNVDKALNDLNARLLTDGGNGGGVGIVERQLVKCDFDVPDWEGKISAYRYEADWKIDTETGDEELFVKEGKLQGFGAGPFQKPYLAEECDGNNFRVYARLYIPIVEGKSTQYASIYVCNYEANLPSAERTPSVAQYDVYFEVAVRREADGRKQIFFREQGYEAIWMEGDYAQFGTDTTGDFADVFLEVKDGKVTAMTVTDVETGELLPDNRQWEDAPPYNLRRGISFYCYGERSIGLKSVRITELIKTV